MEPAPSLGLCRRIVDLVSTGATSEANGLVEVEHGARTTSRLVVNRTAAGTRSNEIRGWIRRFGGEPRPRGPTGTQELRDARNAPHPARPMHRRDYPVGLAPTVGGVEPGGCGGLPTRAGQAPSQVGRADSRGPVSDATGEEARVAGRHGPAPDNLRGVRCEADSGELSDTISPRPSGHGMKTPQDRYRASPIDRCAPTAHPAATRTDHPRNPYDVQDIAPHSLGPISTPMKTA